MSPRARQYITSGAILLGCLGITLGLVLTVKNWDWRSARDAPEDLPGPSLGPDNPPSPESFHPVRTVPRPPLVSDFQTVPVASAADKVKEEELVLGVSVKGESRAYPINMLTGPTREIVNDTLGGRAIAATW